MNILEMLSMEKKKPKLLHEMPFALIVNKLCIEIEIDLYITVKLLENQINFFMN
jgi:hypothetical protein